MILPQLYEWAEIRANGAICPIPSCGAVVVTYRVADSLDEPGSRYNGSCEFTCPECGFEFVASGSDLIFRSVPRDWLLSEVCHA